MIWFFIILGIFIFSIVCTILYFKLKKKYALVKNIAGTVTDADKYLSDTQAKADQLLSDTQAKVAEYESKYEDLQRQSSELKKELSALELRVLVDSVSIDAYENLKSDEIKNKLAVLKSKQDSMVKDGAAVKISSEYLSRVKKRTADNQIKQILRCFNSETTGIIENVTVKNVDSSRAKIQRSFDALNKIFDTDGVSISREYLSSKLEELSLVYGYMVKQAEEAEQRRAIREQMVEDEKVHREIEREKQKIEKEEAQFKNEEKKLMSYLQKSKDDAERQLYMDKIRELQEKLSTLQKDKENVLQREQNTRAGFVYIISNIGSFGEDVYKIGMTRRLEPMDRIAELSSASVPFVFDVHALIFSEDAPGLEATLHQYFDSKRVNKINPRKEFFRVDLDEIKSVVTKNHNATVKFVDVPDAIEYRETLKIEKQSAEKKNDDI